MQKILERRKSRSRRALTLVETVMASMVMGIVVASTMSAAHIVLSGASSLEAKNNATNDLALAMLRLRNELRFALTITELTDKTISFTVFDIDGDDVDDILRYAWSGTTGDPLTRQINMDSPTTLVQNCTRFDLQADVGELKQNLGPAWSPETLIAAHDTCPNNYSQVLATLNTNHRRYLAQSFIPEASGATKCKITRARISLRVDSSGVDEELLVTIREANKYYSPAPTVLSQAIVPYADLPTSQQWCEVGFSNQPEIPTGSIICLVISGGATSDAHVGFNYLLSGSYDDGTTMFASNDAGVGWSPLGYQTIYDLRVYIYGHYDTNIGGTGVLLDGKVINMIVGLSAGEGREQASADAVVNCMNEPPIPGLNINDVQVRTTR